MLKLAISSGSMYDLDLDATRWLFEICLRRESVNDGVMGTQGEALLGFDCSSYFCASFFPFSFPFQKLLCLLAFELVSLATRSLEDEPQLIV
jgi:hypothetical protein